jgi:hypothetical protein
LKSLSIFPSEVNLISQIFLYSSSTKSDKYHHAMIELSGNKAKLSIHPLILVSSNHEKLLSMVPLLFKRAIQSTSSPL